MLSPTMMTNSNGKTVRAFVISAPISYCDLVPVPVSPMIANRTESLSFGVSTSSADCAACARTECGRSSGSGTVETMASPRTKGRRVRMAVPLLLLRRSSVQHVNHEVGITVSEEQLLIDEAVFELFGQLRKPRQELRRHRRQRECCRIRLVDGQLELLRQFGKRRFLVGRAPRMPVFGDDLAKEGR